MGGEDEVSELTWVQITQNLGDIVRTLAFTLKCDGSQRGLLSRGVKRLDLHFKNVTLAAAWRMHQRKSRAEEERFVRRSLQ